MTASKNTEFEPLSLSEALLDADHRGNLRR